MPQTIRIYILKYENQIFTRLKMKLAPILAICMTMFLIAAISPGFASSVAYTYTLADLGQGGWGGGPLFTNGQT